MEIEITACNFVKELPVKSRRIILKQLRRLEDPYLVSEIEKIGRDIFRLHIGRTYTIFFIILPDRDLVRVTDILPIETAHKRYRRIE